MEGFVDAKAEKEAYYEKQINYLQDLIRDDENNPNLYYLKANAEYEIKQWAAALEDISMATSLDSTVGSYFFLAAKNHFAFQNYEDVLFNLQKASQKSFNHPFLNILKAKSFLKLNEMDSAFHTLMVSEKEIPNSTQLKRAWGEYYFIIGDSKKVKKINEEILSINPYDTLAYAYLIKDAINTNDFVLAKEVLDSAKNKNVSSLPLLTCEGELLVVEKYLDSAEVIFTDVLRQDPSQWEASRHLGKLLRKKGLTLEAKKVFLEGLKIKQDCKELWYELGLTEQYLIKDYGEARSNYEKALEIDPAYLDARKALNNLRAILRRMYAPPPVEEASSSEEENTTEANSSEEIN
ncbi:hypothetical protein MY04_2999 [Flammeovirga sp. MY04]|uniref:tetratricopeptide repeat protein n=1 Tax=Flammeovirga sp. MY04 TaxID=1191459 RepID=UPI0008063214|nr:hypothetical protein [Flammeovirga sp. MY04]ANQ50367.1 hypothetical protein MY04_2999 [Flammeovirga sp. MY04]